MEMKPAVTTSAFNGVAGATRGDGSVVSKYLLARCKQPDYPGTPVR